MIPITTDYSPTRWRVVLLTPFVRRQNDRRVNLPTRVVKWADQRK
jgi:hypothetical protein